MPVCSKCGLEVVKLTEHAQTREKLCLKCVTQSGSGLFAPPDDLLTVEDERRGGVRIPLTIVMSFALFDENQQTEIKYPAFSINLSQTGICFGWDACSFCKGYIPNGVDPNCVFYPFSINNENSKELMLEFKLTKTYSMRVETVVVYTLKEENLGIEYVGAQFVNLSGKNQQVLEKIIMRYGLG